MKKQDFIQSVRKGEAKFRVDKIEIATDGSPLTGKGSLQVLPGRFKLHVVLDDGCKAPGMQSGVRTRREFWNVRGVIEDEIGFSLHSLPNNISQNYTFGQPTKQTLDFSAGHIDLVPIGFDNLTVHELYNLQMEATGQPQVAASFQQPQNTNVTFHAILPNFKLIERNGGTETIRKNVFLGESTQSSLDTFHGESPAWKYGLIQKDGDLHVHFISKPEHKSQGEEQDQRLFRAFLNTLAFTHGQHAWPFSMEYRRDSKLVVNRIHLHEDVADSPHAPFNEAMGFNNLTKNISWNFSEVLDRSYTFFSSDSKISHEVENLLFIFREATSNGIPKKITLLSLCSLLESLVRLIYEEQVASKNSVETADFQKIKIEIREGFLKRKQPAYDRLAAILSNADPVNMRMRFEAVVEHLNLQPANKWKDLYGTWSSYRNPISHRMSKGNGSEDSAQEELFAESQIAGTINCMILKLMDYSGFAIFSAYEEKYAKI